MAGIEILEGFLCPICVQDLGSVAQLQDHFELAHAGEDKALLNQIKGLFGKAKRKLLGQENDHGEMFAGSTVDNTSTLTSFGGIDPVSWDPQELGVCRSQTDLFKSVRNSRIDRFIIETNKLLIRLDKLINCDAGLDANKRKVFEKSIVTWAPDADANLCMTCGKHFTITRRRHHCRLCGRIVCNKCSHFLPFDFAKKLTNPAFAYEGEGFRRSSSNSSLNSIFSPEGDVHIRTCNDCRFLLERRDEQMVQRNFKPVIAHLYERIRGSMDEAEQLIPRYTQMANSLNSGDSSYDLHEAQEIRQKLARLYENIGSLNKRIAVIGLDNPEPPTPKALRLQQMISAHASAFLQENLIGLHSLPTPEELTRLQDIKRQEAQKRIAEEKRLAAERERKRKEQEEEQERLSAAAAAGRRSTQEGITSRVHYRTRSADNKLEIAAGWKPVEVPRSRNSDDDPMVQQMNIIRSYIKQAQDAGKWDEVHMLEENLRELQGEFWSQQQQQQQQQPRA